MNRITEQTAYENVRKSVRYTLDDLIHPSDVIDGASSWKEVPDELIIDECSESADIILQERQNPSIMQTIDELAVSKVADSLARVPNHALADDWSLAEFVREARVWPYRTDRTTMWETVIQTNVPLKRAYPNEWMEARETAHRAIVGEMSKDVTDS